jgi:isocitrate dehydrogenase kinase/phosphatase
VGRHDVFPEEFTYFLGLPPELREVFLEYHSNLFEVTFWQDIQSRLRAGEIFNLAPYGAEKLLHPRCLLPN